MRIFLMTLCHFIKRGCTFVFMETLPYCGTLGVFMFLSPLRVLHIMVPTRSGCCLHSNQWSAPCPPLFSGFVQFFAEELPCRGWGLLIFLVKLDEGSYLLLHLQMGTIEKVWRYTLINLATPYGLPGLLVFIFLLSKICYFFAFRANFISLIP